MKHRLLLLIMLPTSVVFAQVEPLQKQIEAYLASKKATVGVAIWHFGNGDTLSVNGKNRYPLQSVYKFHVGLAVLAEIDKGRWTLDTPIYISKADLSPNLYSPMREAYPNGEVNIPLREVLKYTVGQSDNSGCDVLFKLIGGCSKVENYLKKLGIKQTRIRNTEAQIQANWETQFANWTTPWAMVQALQKFYKGNILSESSYEFLWQTMAHTPTGTKRMRGLLPAETTVAHKTGTSGQRDNIYAAINDAGIIILPNGEALGLVVLVSSSFETEEASQRIIAEIGKMAWDFYVSPK